MPIHCFTFSCTILLLSFFAAHLPKLLLGAKGTFIRVFKLNIMRQAITALYKRTLTIGGNNFSVN